jgi:beta-fructofuranosidase
VSIFFRPKDGWVGDAIPCFHAGEFWLFYLHDLRTDTGGTAWQVVRTSDFVTFAEVGTAIPSGGADAPDFNAYTGSVVEVDGRHHLFYTGHNPRRTDPATGEALQLVMHAVSDDGMRSWTKIPEDTFGAPPGYEAGDWRDPFVFRDGPGSPWRMLITARVDHGPARRRGLIAQCESDDLHSWRVVQPFWQPSLYVGHECPDLFAIGDRWYLVYSEFSERFTTRYRVAPGPDGPWSVPDRDTVDGRAFYAAKTVHGDGRRYAVGWIPTKTGECDDGEWEWAGDMAVHEVTASANGELLFSLPDSVAAAFTEPEPVSWQPAVGEWNITDGTASTSVPSSFASVVSEVLPDECKVSVDIDIAAGSTAAGLVLRAGPDGEAGYQIRLEPRRQRMTFDRWPRRRTGPMQWQISGDVPHVVELERPARLSPGRHRLDVLVDGTACVAYLDGEVAMSARMYDRRTGGLALFVQEGAASFHDLTVTTRK